ncbi:MAG: tetraacyldisaccharide 4'-kinase [Holosporaceae bacterium]|jgi:tetraacyldisaccharide 4'-kinase|nr:tetraacyldisaccharide 4'-kinase [Holosporaceae bacterium]
MIFFRTPKFWRKRPNLLLKYLLKPISGVYSYISAKNYKKKYGYKSAKAKVVAVGAITVGGSGKTIVTESICRILIADAKKTAVLSRGYGRLSRDVLRVDSCHSFEDVGDEPLLLFSHGIPVFVGVDRSQSAQMAENCGFDFLVMDDGISQKYLRTDLKFVVIDAAQGVGNDEMFPLGPKRLDFDKIKFDIDAVIILESKIGDVFDAVSFPQSMPVIHGRLTMDFSVIKDRRIIAFCGLGFPDKFFDSLTDFEIVKTVDFPDHHPFSNSEVQRLIADAENFRARLVTTEKDLARVPQKYRDHITAIPVRITWKDEKLLRDLLLR